MLPRSIVALLAALVPAAISGLLIGLPARADVEVRMATGLNIPGGDIQNIALNVPDPGLCRQACDNRQDCRAWSYVKPGVQGALAMCWLKGTVGQGTFDRNVISGVKPGDSGPAPGAARVDGAMDLGVDYSGNDLGGFALASGDPALCRQACDGRGDCRAWTFVEPGVQGPAALCFLKTGVGQIIPGQAVISGVRSAPVPVAATPPGTVAGTPTAGGAAAVTWGVWAFRARPPWDWADACGIQYVASTMTSRYATDTANYRLVRTRPGQREADLDIHEFSAFHKDQPDGVVKFRPCNPGTQVTAGGAAGGSTGGAQGGGVIQVVSGTYGGNCRQPEGNKTGHLAGACNGRGSCRYTINHTVIGDPAYGCQKDYVAKWTCSGGGGMRETRAAPEAGFGSTIGLSC